MLAQRRSLKLNGKEIERTPLLIPSFSSKGFPDVQKIIEYSSEIIEGSTLVSAYDLHYKKINPPFDFASLIFLDSGGYEASKDTELSDFGERDHFPKEWTPEMHEAQLKRWQPSVPSVIISYDHPKARLPIDQQIDRAKKMAPGRSDLMREILLKPETEAQNLLQIENIVTAVHGLAGFDAIGVTEKEIGNSILARMQNIARLRKALSEAGIRVPIHVFGSLDTVTTPLYFLAGADIFDGLTWLRFAFHEGHTLYKQNYGALNLGVKTPAHVIDGRCWNNNYYYMTELALLWHFFGSGSV
ncbi:hypothetical protein [Mesorhizobium sp. NZP2077]|uniref:hypothetical protein n=1 Tax=Mesorhizobium sp. NZP2077 TaxID=2483404 RepID=UPI001AEDB0CA|nr:hypothetical protein [Mesorhizobium sp. NZP2077]